MTPPWLTKKSSRTPRTGPAVLRTGRTVALVADRARVAVPAALEIRLA